MSNGKLFGRVAFKSLSNINRAPLWKYVECLKMIGLMLMAFYMCGEMSGGLHSKDVILGVHAVG